MRVATNREGYIIVIIVLFFFFNDTATTEIYTLSLHDALPISYKKVENCLYLEHSQSLHVISRVDMFELEILSIFGKKKGWGIGLVFPFRTLYKGACGSLLLLFCIQARLAFISIQANFQLGFYFQYFPTSKKKLKAVYS